MKVEVLLSNNFNLFSLDILNIDFSNCVCVVIDVIRATSTIATLFGVGAEKIIITRTKRQSVLGLKSMVRMQKLLLFLRGPIQFLYLAKINELFIVKKN